MIDFVSEYYINIAFSVGINSTNRTFDSFFTSLNNIFASILALTIVVMPVAMAVLLYKKLGAANKTLVQALEGGEKDDPFEIFIKGPPR